MLLAIDIGNTNIVVGGIANDQIVFEARIATDPIKTSDQYAAEIKSILALFQTDLKEIDDSIISSVVPPVFNSVRTGIIKLTHKEPIVVGPGIKTGLNIQMDDPASVGSDLIVAAVAAVQDYQPPLIIIDMGTATTVCAIGRGNTYLGGVVIPGIRVSADSLTHSTALLHTLCVYLLQEQNLHATARQLFIHRNTLVYRLQRIRTLLQLDLDDAAVRNVLRTGCILLEYYQGAF